MCVAGETIAEDGTCVQCPFGTYDADSDLKRRARQRTVCPKNKITAGVCSPTSNVSCLDCGINPSDYIGDLYGDAGPHSIGCDERDPNM